jgi:hypothetical protein
VRKSAAAAAAAALLLPPPPSLKLLPRAEPGAVWNALPAWDAARLAALRARWASAAQTAS